MHDFIFEHGINAIYINKIYLMGRFKSSYVFIPLGFYFIRIMTFSPWKMGGYFFVLRGDFTVENLVGGDYLPRWCFLVLGGRGRGNHVTFSSLNPPNLPENLFAVKYHDISF